MLSASLRLVLLCAFVARVKSHSWIDTICDAANPEDVGYPRNYAGHDADPSITTYKTLVDDTSLLACGPSQRLQSYSPQYPELQATAGSQLIATYQENGHVTKDKLPPDGLPHPGNYSWYILPVSSAPITFADLNATTLLSGPSDFDDGKCAVDAAGIQGRPGPITCLSKFTLPSTLQPGSSYQLVWWWDFTKLTAIDPSYIEWYTTCLDVLIVEGTASEALESSESQGDGVAAISSRVVAVNNSADSAAPSLTVMSVKYPNITYVAPTPVVEADVLLLSSTTSTYTYSHPTVAVPASAQVDAVQEASDGALYYPATMIVNLDGSLSPYPGQKEVEGVPVSVTVLTSSTSSSSASVAPTPTSSGVLVTTVYIPTYVTLTPTACPVSSVTTEGEDLSSSVELTTVVMTTTVVVQNQKRKLEHVYHRHHHNHQHGLPR